jgi:hypothetical protein
LELLVDKNSRPLARAWTFLQATLPFTGEIILKQKRFGARESTPSLSKMARRLSYPSLSED